MTNPSASDVARRLEILKYQVVYSMTVPPDEAFAVISAGWSAEEHTKFQYDLQNASDKFVEAMKIGHLWELMTVDEKEFLSSVPPKVDRQQHLNAMWNQESVAVLMWSLGIIDSIPSYDTQSDPEIVKHIPDVDLHHFISSANLRQSDEIESQRAHAELWHWRARTRQLIDEKRALPSGTGFATFDEIVRNVAQQAFQSGDILNILDDDFVALGKPYRELNADESSEVLSITFERHRAFNWLCGYSEENRWDAIPTDT